MFLVEHLPNINECILDIVSSLSRCLCEVIQIFYLLELFCFVITNLPLILPVLLVAYQEAEGVGLGLLLDLTEPVIHIRKSVQASYVVSQKYGMRTSVENLCYRLEVLLASGVPDLQFYPGVVDFKKECSELYSHRDLVVFHELICGHPVHEAGFSNTAVTDNNQLE